ncbi:TPA: hypothetical protein DDW35_00030 [Candidatus Sumerlaeota bacterium]|nr:hypothetical protein [Candidatus Sumerlaeota bacterium]
MEFKRSCMDNPPSEVAGVGREGTLFCWEAIMFRIKFSGGNLVQSIDRQSKSKKLVLLSRGRKPPRQKTKSSS